MHMQAATADPSDEIPVMPLLGYFSAPSSDDAYAITNDPSDSLWLVYKWEALKPLTLLLQDPTPPKPPQGLPALLKGK